MATLPKTPTVDEPAESAPPTEVKVKNVTDRTVFLASGLIKPGEEGVATYAESETLADYIQKV